MRRVPALIVTGLMLVSCPPPAYLEIYNNTSEPLTVLGSSKPREIAAQSSSKARFRDLVYWRPAGPDLHEPVLAIQRGSQIHEYTQFQTQAEAFLDLYGSIRTWKLQFEPDGRLLVVRPEDSSPVPPDYEQPEPFPIIPVMRSTSRPAA